jgi:rubrerythrin
MPSLNDWTSRWDTFAGKLTTRLDEVQEEALGAFGDVAATAPLDHTPQAALESAVQARHNKLGDKLDTAVETLDNELDELAEDTDDDRALARIEALRDRAIQQQQELQSAIDRAEQSCKVHGAAVIAQAIEAAFQNEDATQSCVQCGNPFEPPPIAQSTSVSCPGCGAKLTVGPHPAAMAWYSRGLAAVAEAEAWPQWVAYRAAETHYNDEPSTERLTAHVQAAEAYHRAVFGVLVQRHPSWDTAKAEEQVRGRCAQIRSMHERFQA